MSGSAKRFQRDSCPWLHSHLLQPMLRHANKRESRGKSLRLIDRARLISYFGDRIQDRVPDGSTKHSKRNL